MAHLKTTVILDCEIPAIIETDRIIESVNKQPAFVKINIALAFLDILNKDDFENMKNIERTMIKNSLLRIAGKFGLTTVNKQ